MHFPQRNYPFGHQPFVKPGRIPCEDRCSLALVARQDGILGGARGGRFRGQVGLRRGFRCGFGVYQCLRCKCQLSISLCPGLLNRHHPPRRGIGADATRGSSRRSFDKHSKDENCLDSRHACGHSRTIPNALTFKPDQSSGAGRTIPRLDGTVTKPVVRLRSAGDGGGDSTGSSQPCSSSKRNRDWRLAA